MLNFLMLRIMKNKKQLYCHSGTLENMLMCLRTPTTEILADWLAYYYYLHAILQNQHETFEKKIKSAKLHTINFWLKQIRFIYKTPQNGFCNIFELIP